MQTVKQATEGILQSNAVATLKEGETGAEFEVAEGEFELLTEGETVAVTGAGGMFGLFGAGLAAGGLAGPLAAAAGAAFVLGSDDRRRRIAGGGSSGGGSGEAAAGALEPVTDAAGPASPALEETLDALSPVTTVVDAPVGALAPVTEALDPVLEETAPITDALEPALTPVNDTLSDALTGLGTSDRLSG